MRLTVGPLPSAVYWRRRVLVLGALLLIVVALYASCGSDSGADPKKSSGTSSPSPTVGGEESEAPVLTPESGGPAGGDPDPSSGTEAGADATGAAPPPQAPVDTSPCTDDEITLTPVPAKPVLARGASVDLRLVITNSSDRSCARDVGADWQELRIVQGAEMIWSSDRCGAAKGSDVQTFSPGGKREFMITWNGESSSKCGAGVPTGAAPPAGRYQLIGRLGMKHSKPVTLTIQAP